MIATKILNIMANFIAMLLNKNMRQFGVAHEI